MAVYLLHFDRAYHHARHYLGWSPEVQARVNAHIHGRGARLTEVVHSAGIGMMWVRTWEDGDRVLERKLKNRHSPQLCPICCGKPVQVPLLPWMPAYVPEPEQDDANHDHDTLAPPTGPDLFDYDGELEDLIEGREDEDFWRSGHW